MANCELAEASTLSRPPAKAVTRDPKRRPPTVSSDLGTGARRASISGAIGRLRSGSSPSMTTVPLASSATAARKRSVVPDSPAFSTGPPATGRPEVPVTFVMPPTSSMRAPRALRPEVIAAVSSLSSTRLRALVPSARAAITSRRLVRLLEDGA